jgi:hypothetical protein
MWEGETFYGSCSLLFFAFPPSIFQWLATNYLPTANHRATDGPGIRCLATLSTPIFTQANLFSYSFKWKTSLANFLLSKEHHESCIFSESNQIGKIPKMSFQEDAIFEKN